MKLQPLQQSLTQNFGTREGTYAENSIRGFRATGLLHLLLASLWCLMLGSRVAVSQQTRMVIDGTIRADGMKFPSTARVRILHEDSTVDRTVRFYDPQSNRFGVRLSSNDGFSENEKILFRVVVTAQDSFIARSVGPSLVFRGTKEPSSAPTTKIELFRNALPTVYRSLRDTTVREGQILRYRFVAVDRDADTVRYTMRNAPPGAVIDPVTGLFSWVPTFDQSGIYRIRFLISDGFDTDSSHLPEVTVKNVDRPPRFFSVLTDTTMREGDTLRFALKADDPDHDILLYQPVQVPEGLMVDSLKGDIAWVPSYEQAGMYRVRFLVSDGLLTDTTSLAKITVLNADRPPVFTSRIADTTISEDQELLYEYKASDPDKDSIWFSLKIGPEGVSLNSAGALRWKPTFTQAGAYTIVVSAHDQEMATDAVGRIRVLNTDRAPGSFALRQPFKYDTVRLVLSTPVRFAWSHSVDPDSGDLLKYTLRVWGPKLDTTILNLADTTVLINIKPLLQPLSRYQWTATANDGMLSVSSADTFSFNVSEGITGSAEMLSVIPGSYELEQVFPDPFNPMTTIRYALPERSYVRITIFNMLGESLLVLVSGEKDAGVYDVTFDASDFTSGAYMFRLDAHPLAGYQTKDFVNTKKMIIVR